MRPDDSCFLLLFPSHQTWYLVVVLVGFVWVVTPHWPDAKAQGIRSVRHSGFESRSSCAQVSNKGRALRGNTLTEHLCPSLRFRCHERAGHGPISHVS